MVRQFSTPCGSKYCSCGISGFLTVLRRALVMGTCAVDKKPFFCSAQLRQPAEEGPSAASNWLLKV